MRRQEITTGSQIQDIGAGERKLGEKSALARTELKILHAVLFVISWTIVFAIYVRNNFQTMEKQTSKNILIA